MQLRKMQATKTVLGQRAFKASATRPAPARRGSLQVPAPALAVYTRGFSCLFRILTGSPVYGSLR